VDRFAAVASLSMELWKIFAMLFYSRKAVFYWQLLSVLLAVSAFISGQNAQLELNINSFIFWHNLWHFYPLTCIIIQFYDYFVLGEYDRIKNQYPEKQSFFSSLSLIRSKSVHQTLVNEFLRRGMPSENTFSSSLADKKTR
jgi:hypothetical protein